MGEDTDQRALNERIAGLEARVRSLEDELAVVRIVCQWGPAVDTGSSEAAGDLFAADGILESDLSHLEGPAEVAAMVESEGQQALVRQGCAHVQTAPVVTVEGNRATVTSYSQVFLHTERGHEIWRVSANLWQLRRTSAGWRVTRRANRVIDGGPEAHVLLASGLDRPPG